MAAGVAAATVPFCGACGFDANESLNNDVFCDACGADLTRFGFAGLFPPADLVAVGGSLQVQFEWTANLDTSDILYQINGGTPTLVVGADPSPLIVSGLTDAGDKVSGSVRTVLNGVNGPWSAIVSASATA